MGQHFSRTIATRNSRCPIPREIGFCGCANSHRHFSTRVERKCRATSSWEKLTGDYQIISAGLRIAATSQPFSL